MRQWVVGIVGIAAASVLGLAAVRGGAQEDNFRLLSRALVGPKAAYIPLPPEVVSPGKVGYISPSLDGQDALIMIASPSLPRTAEDLFAPEPPGIEDERLRQQIERDGRVDMNVLLWSRDARRAQTVWRGGGSFATGLRVPANLEWFMGTRVALLQVLEMRGPFTPEQMQTGHVKPTATLIRVNGATGKTLTVAARTDLDAPLLISPYQPAIAVVTDDGATVQVIRATGAASAPVAVTGLARKDGDFVSWYGWLPEGKLYGVHTTEADGKTQRHRIILDTATGAMSDDPQPKALVTPTKNDLPLVVHRGRETLMRDGAAETVYPLWLEGREKETVGRTLIAADSDPDTQPVVLQTAVLYQHHGALYAVPLLKSGGAEFVARRREAQKQETIKRARQLGTAFLMYGQDYDENLPPVGTDMTQSVRPYVRDESAFHDPLTGRTGFTPLYTNPAFASWTMPATTPLGTLSGPGGAAVIFLDGHVEWKDQPGDSKP